jgi:GDP/UDP-N,N'-diacetylbacillosamine 2-epimerase (hydrolysing)
MKFYSKKFLQKKFKIKFKKDVLLITYQPLSLKIESSKKEISALINAIKGLNNYTIIFTFPNFDVGSNFVIDKIKKLKKENNNIYFYKSLGHKNYLSLANISSAVVGNSSSGIIEIPYLGIPVVNIGERQNGRVKHNSIINCKTNSKEIKNSIIKAIKNTKKIKIKTKKNKIYGKGNSSKKIFKIFNNKIIKIKNKYEKKFIDLI